MSKKLHNKLPLWLQSWYQPLYVWVCVTTHRWLSGCVTRNKKHIADFASLSVGRERRCGRLAPSPGDRHIPTQLHRGQHRLYQSCTWISFCHALWTQNMLFYCFLDCLLGTPVLLLQSILSPTTGCFVNPEVALKVTIYFTICNSLFTLISESILSIQKICPQNV